MVQHKGAIPWNKGISPSKDMRERISRTLKEKYANGLKAGFQKGHPPYNSKLKEWRENGGIPWNKGLPVYRQPNWKGGITSFNSQVRKSAKYFEWRDKVFERDKYTCVLCGIHSGLGKTVVLNADHIKSFASILHENKIETLEQAISCLELWNTSNGRTLCKSCHGRTDNFLWKGLIVSAKGRQEKTLKQV